MIQKEEQITILNDDDEEINKLNVPNQTDKNINFDNQLIDHKSRISNFKSLKLSYQSKLNT